MSQNLAITIGRQCGAGGEPVAKILAEKLGLKVYNHEILDHAAAHSGISRELFHEYDEKANTSFLYSLVMDSYSIRAMGGDKYAGVPIDQRVFMAQYETIQKLADEAPSVFIGRCADYALEKHSNHVSVFLTADEKAKITRIQEAHACDERKAKEVIAKIDKRRSTYYNYNTSRKWGAGDNYDLCINTTKVGYEGAAQIIIDYMKMSGKLA